MPETEQKGTIVVDDKKCISCGICVSLCPHNALTMQDGLPVVTGKCRVCGLCAASCITKAISMKAKKFTDEGLLADVNVENSLIVFACRRKIEKDKDYGENVRVISLLCSARFDPLLAAEVFERGAVGVAVVGCEECRNKYGSSEAANKVWMLNEALKMLGDDANRVVFANSIDEAVKALTMEPLKINAALLKSVTLDRNVRALIAKMRQICEEGNVYGEKIAREKYEEVVKNALDLAVKVATISHYAAGGAKISEVAERSGLDASEIMQAVLEMRRRDAVAIEVDEELVIIPR